MRTPGTLSGRSGNSRRNLKNGRAPRRKRQVGGWPRKVGPGVGRRYWREAVKVRQLHQRQRQPAAAPAQWHSGNWPAPRGQAVFSAPAKRSQVSVLGGRSEGLASAFWPRPRGEGSRPNRGGAIQTGSIPPSSEWQPGRRRPLRPLRARPPLPRSKGHQRASRASRVWEIFLNSPRQRHRQSWLSFA